jgi:hypothetical protein
MAGLSTSDITKMLRNPQTVTAADAAQIAALKQAFPYFTIGHYLDAMVQYKEQPYSNNMLNELNLYKGNWLLLHELLTTGQVVEETAATNAVEKPAAPIAEQALTEQVVTATEPGVTAKVEQPVTIADTSETTEIEDVNTNKEEPLIQPVFTEDYFRHQGVDVSTDLPEAKHIQQPKEDENDDEDKSLMVVMSFSEWLSYFNTKNQKQKEEEEDKRALKTMWQKEKLAAALEEENDEIPEEVFEMAVNSITKEDDLASESLAEIHVKQGKYDKAIDMYRKLSLRNPQKSAYFARKIETILKEKQS